MLGAGQWPALIAATSALLPVVDKELSDSKHRGMHKDVEGVFALKCGMRQLGVGRRQVLKTQNLLLECMCNCVLLCTGVQPRQDDVGVTSPANTAASG